VFLVLKFFQEILRNAQYSTSRASTGKGSTQKAAIVKLPHIERIAEEVAAGASLLVRAQRIVEKARDFQK